jgi:hypothetical protein
LYNRTLNTDRHLLAESMIYHNHNKMETTSYFLLELE